MRIAKKEALACLNDGIGIVVAHGEDKWLIQDSQNYIGAPNESDVGFSVISEYLGNVYYTDLECCLDDTIEGVEEGNDIKAHLECE